MIIEFYKVKILMFNFLYINVVCNVSFVVKKKIIMLKFFLIFFNDCIENKKKSFGKLFM